MITLIVAADKNWLIGKNNRLPWVCKEDLEHFKKTTMGCPIIMGRCTFESLPKVLPGREHFVITSKPINTIDIPNNDAHRVHICSSIIDAINGALASSEPRKNKTRIGDKIINILEDEVFIIGGATLYHDAMEKDLVDRVIVSRMNLAIDADDTSKYFFFEQWKHKFALSFEEEFKDFVLQTWDRDPEKKWIE